MAPPGVGATQVFYNTRERLVSTDHNREQAKEAQTLAEVLRFLFDARSDLDVPAGGVEVMGTGLESSLRGTVINGLRVRPEIGGVSLFIEPGVALLVDNSAPGVDDSKMAFVTDPGQQVGGVLTLTPGSGGTRIDVIECQRILSTLESDNRDVFNTATGLFSPALVDKIKAGRLAYRIRTGTAGAGFPGLAAGWMPLAVASVPSAASTWNDVTMWDVRPLASDRIAGPFGSYHSLPDVRRHLLYTDVITDPARADLRGKVDVSFDAYRAGGRIVSDADDSIDIRSTDYHSPGFAFGPNQLWYLYLLFPFSLPRWVRYSHYSTGSRVPRGLRGIPVLSAVGPRFNGRPAGSLIQSPSWTGLLDTPSNDAIVAVAGRSDNSGTPVPLGVNGDGRVIQLINPNALENAASSVSGTTSATWLLVDGSTHPGNARAVYIKFKGSFAAPGALRFSVQGLIEVSGPDNDTAAMTRVALDGTRHFIEYASSGTLIASFSARVPLAPDFTMSTARQFALRWTFSTNGSVTPSDLTAEVVGWELGP
jgi:hypothetical protein